MPHDNRFSNLDTLLDQAELDQQTYVPQQFRLGFEEDRCRLTALLEDNRDIVVFDQLEAQLTALIKTCHPTMTPKPGQLKLLVAQHLDGQRTRDYGVWIYYPWSRRLVHILDKDEFVRLRTSRNQYKITQEEQASLADEIIGVIGLSVGQSVALTMAMERCFGEIRLADYDSLELTNLNRLRTGLHNLGLLKVIIAAREIAEIDPFLRVRCFTKGLTEGNLDRFLMEGGKLSILIEECDSIDMKFLCRRRASELHIPVVMDTCDRGMVDVERFDLEPERPLFHGVVDEPPVEKLKQLGSEEKVPYVLSILGHDSLSTRVRASLLEVGNSISTWPQLATSVALGGAVTGDVCRRILLGSFRSSGRYYVDLEQLIADPKENDRVRAHHDRRNVDNASFEHLNQLRMEQIADAAEHLLPANGSSIGPVHLMDIVRAATMAPSGGNMQPWRWLYRNRRLSLFHDQSKSESLLDFANRGSYLSLGAAAENLVLQAHSLGLEVVTLPFPIPSEKQLVASFSFFPAGFESDSSIPLELHVCDDLREFVPLRLTNRQIDTRAPVEANKLDAIVQAARTVPGAELSVVSSEDELIELGRIIAASDRLRILHPRGHADFVNEIRWTSDEARQTRDGIDLATVDLSAGERSGLQIARNWPVVEQLRRWHLGKGFEALSRKSVAAASAMGLVRMRGTTPKSFFDGGRAVQRAWLEASRQKLAFQPLSGVTFLFFRLLAESAGESNDALALSQEMKSELPQLRERFVKIFPARDFSDVFLFRLAIAAPPTVRSLRRPVEDVLIAS